MCVGTINALDPTCPRTCVAFVTVLLSEAIKVCSITFGMAVEPTDESKWLKSHYEEAATGDVPTPSKRVKYQTLKDDIELHFPHRTYNDLVVKGFIKEAFPMSSTKRLGKLRHTHQLSQYGIVLDLKLTSSIVGVRFITPTLINICTFLGALT